MVPSTHSLERMPLGPTGKTDRRRLREIGSFNYGEIAAQRQGAQRIAPSSQMESPLLEVWMDVLNLPATQPGFDLVVILLPR